MTTSPTGNDTPQARHSHPREREDQSARPSDPRFRGDDRARAGFTLVEVMLAVCILGLGTVMVQQGFLRSAGLVGGASARLEARMWMHEALWQQQENLVFADPPSAGSGEGGFREKGREFEWKSDVQPAPSGKDLYVISLSVSWQEDGQTRTITDETLAALRPRL